MWRRGKYKASSSSLVNLVSVYTPCLSFLSSKNKCSIRNWLILSWPWLQRLQMQLLCHGFHQRYSVLLKLVTILLWTNSTLYSWEKYGDNILLVLSNRVTQAWLPSLSVTGPEPEYGPLNSESCILFSAPQQGKVNCLGHSERRIKRFFVWCLYVNCARGVNA